jgi:hypothetical protein
VGRPTALSFNIPSQAILCATDAGLLYAWRAATFTSAEDTSFKGALLAGYPIQIPGGRITQIGFIYITDGTILGNLGLGSASTVLAIYNDAGQVHLLRMPPSS